MYIFKNREQIAIISASMIFIDEFSKKTECISISIFNTVLIMIINFTQIDQILNQPKSSFILSYFDKNTEKG